MFQRLKPSKWAHQSMGTLPSDLHAPPKSRGRVRVPFRYRVLRRLGFGPASASAPFVATLVDVTGLVIYFSAGLVILRGTLLGTRRR